MRVLALAAALVVLVLACPGPALASSEPEHCKVGAYISDLYDLDPAKRSFSARLWLWSVCPDKKLPLLANASFSNANDPAKNTPSSEEKAGKRWDQVNVQGSFRQNWNVNDFPFDRHRLEILVTATQDLNTVRLEPDPTASYRSDIRLPGWRFEGLHLTTVERHYKTAFGDPTLPPGSGSAYHQLRIQIDIARDDPTSFFRLTAPLLIIFLVTMLTFLLTESAASAFQGRITALGAALFAVLLSMDNAANRIPSDGGLTMIDQLHILTLVYILLAIAITTVSWRWTVRDTDPARVLRLNNRGILAGTTVYVLATAALIYLAMSGSYG